MPYQRVVLTERYLAGFELIGPWETQVPEGFARLASWVAEQGLIGERIAVYFDDPDITPPEALRCFIAITVSPDYVLPPQAGGATLLTLKAGDYGMQRADIEDDAFFPVWEQLFDALDADDAIQPLPGACFERYLDEPSPPGVWPIEMYVPITDRIKA